MADAPQKFRDLREVGYNAFEALSGAITGSTTALTTFLSVGAAITAVVVGVKLMIDHFRQYEKAVEAATEAKAAYEEQKKEVESLNRELETLNERIDELQAKGALTLTENSELQKLKDESAELQNQIRYEEYLLKLRNEDAYNKAKAAVTTDGFRVQMSDAEIQAQYEATHPLTGIGWLDKFIEGGRTEDTVPGLVETTKRGTLIDHIREQTRALEKLNDQYEEEKKNGQNVFGSLEDAEKHKQDLADLEQQIYNLKAAEQENIDVLYNSIESYKAFGDTAGADALQSLLDGWMVATGELDKEQQELEERQTKINELLSKPTLTDTVDSAKELAKTLNGLTIERLEEDFPELASAIKAAGLDIQEVLDTINSQAGVFDPAAVREQAVMAMLGEADGSTSWLRQFDELKEKIAEISDEDIEILYTILPNIKEGWTFDDLTEAIKQYKSKNNQIDLGLETQAEQVTKLKSSITSLQSAINSQSALSFDVYGADGMEDFASALEQVNNGYQYNIDAVNEIVKAKTEERKAYLEVGKAQAQSKYLENAREIRDLTKNYDNLTAAQKDHLASLQAEQDSAYANIRGFDVLAAEIATSA